MRLLALLLLFVASQAVAQDGIRESDIRLSKAELSDLLADQVLEFYTDGIATYWADGRYDYRYAAGDDRLPGTYEVRDNSMVCTVFEVNGFSRCDYLVRSGERLVMVVESGDRYPVRKMSPIE